MPGACRPRAEPYEAYDGEAAGGPPRGGAYWGPLHCCWLTRATITVYTMPRGCFLNQTCGSGVQSLHKIANLSKLPAIFFGMEPHLRTTSGRLYLVLANLKRALRRVGSLIAFCLLTCGLLAGPMALTAHAEGTASTYD